jgi:lipopolysaccharide export system protein LptA
MRPRRLQAAAWTKGNWVEMGRVGKRTAALLALGALVTIATDAHPLRVAAQAAAQPAHPGPVFGAGSGPIDISADELEVVNTENRAVWKGNVEAIQGMDRLRTPLLTVFFAKSNPAPGAAGAPPPPPPKPASTSASGGLTGNFGSIQRMEAEGPVYYVTPTQNARGDHATYEAASNTIVMTGNVVVVQDKNVVQGDKLTIDTVTNHSVMVSNAQSRTQKRVRGVFYQAQNQTSQSGAGTAPAAKP